MRTSIPPHPLLVPGVALILALATMLVYCCVADFQFINLDDGGYVTDNVHVRTGLTLANVRWAFTTFEASNWHPLTWLSLLFDRTLYGGLKPGGFHFTNAVLHVANTVLLFLLLCRMTGAVWRSALVAALFALHPLHVESVAWVSERKDVLSTLFLLLTLRAYVAYVERPGLGRYSLVVAAFACGLMAKPMLVTLPFVLLLLDYWPLGRLRAAAFMPAGCSDGEDKPRRSWRGLLVEKLPLLALTAVSCVLTVRAQTEAIGSLEHFPLSVRLANALNTYCEYLAKMVWPMNLAVFYPHPGASLSPARVMACAALLVDFTLAAVFAARRWSYLLVGWLWYLGTLVPVVGLVQVGGQAMADRYTYVPLIGIFVALAWAYGDWVEAASKPWLRVAAPAAAVVLLAACSRLTLRQLLTWDNPISVMEHAMEATHYNYFANGYLGHAYLDAGQPQEAYQHFRHAMELGPVGAGGLNGYAVACMALGDYEEAQRALQTALTLDPGMAQAHHNLALACTLASPPKLETALAESRQAVELDGSLAEPRYLLAHLSLLMNQREEAIREYGAALQLDPRWPVIFNQRALRLLADQPASWQIAYALLLAQQACEATRASRPDFLETLAAAEAAAGNYPVAVQVLRRAIALLSANASAEQRRELENRLRDYERQGGRS